MRVGSSRGGQVTLGIKATKDACARPLEIWRELEHILVAVTESLLFSLYIGVAFTADNQELPTSAHAHTDAARRADAADTPAVAQYEYRSYHVAM